jgi:GNAT superfamily N-acetyltransferase
MRRTTAGRSKRLSDATPLEVESAKPGAADAFWRAKDRDWRSDLWNFRVVWHEQSHDIVIRDGSEIVAGLRLRIAASLAHIEALYVLPAYRGRGLGRRLIVRGEELANYYNCHKVTVAVFAEHAAQAFFEHCGYKTEAVLAQHTFKLDVALLRKFLL